MHHPNYGGVGVMRVLYLHQHFSTRAGSEGTRSYGMARKLIERGHRVILVCGLHHGADAGLDRSFMRGARRAFVDDIEVVELRLAHANHHGFIQRTATFLRFALRSGWIAISEPWDLIFATSTPLIASFLIVIGNVLRWRGFTFWGVRDMWP